MVGCLLAFGRGTGIQAAGNAVFAGCGEPAAAAPEFDECPLSRKKPESRIPVSLK